MAEALQETGATLAYQQEDQAQLLATSRHGANLELESFSKALDGSDAENAEQAGQLTTQTQLLSLVESPWWPLHAHLSSGPTRTWNGDGKCGELWYTPRRWYVRWHEQDVYARRVGARL